MSVNKVILVGHLGADPEIRTMSNGDKVANFSVATSERWTDKNTGEKVERTEWHRVTVWRNVANVAEQYLFKGSQVYIEGSLRTRKYQDQTGVDRYITEIQGNVMQLLGSKPSGTQAAGSNAQPNSYAQQQVKPPEPDPATMHVDDDIPF